MKCWIGVVSKEHALVGISGSFAQVCHGKKGPLSRMKAGDWFLLYSPKEFFQDKKPCQKFVGIGQVKSGNVYQFDMGGGFKPFRIDIDFKPCSEVDIKPLIEKLSFIRNKTSWGMAFRFGHLEIPFADFEFIANKMGIDLSHTQTDNEEKTPATKEAKRKLTIVEKPEDKKKLKEELKSPPSRYSLVCSNSSSSLLSCTPDTNINTSLPFKK